MLAAVWKEDYNRQRPHSALEHKTGRAEMTNRERFKRTLNFEPVDRLPMYEWCSCWDKTLERWKSEGLPPHLREHDDIARHFGLDVVNKMWVSPRTTMDDETEYVSDMGSYEKRREELYPEDPLESVWHIAGGRWEKVTKDMAERWAGEQARGDAVIVMELEGYFWYPRTLLGIERHLLSFYDLPDVLHNINGDLAEYNLRAIDRITEILAPDVAVIAEDMSYNHGPMLSKGHFDEFMAPYYRKTTSKLVERDIICMVDSDGDIMPCASWFADVGVDGFEPLERQAGVDIVELRRRHPNLRIIGAYDKMVMPRGEAAMREEFERILPVMKQRGYIPSVDHQTPPGVSLHNYRIYVNLLEEYCTRAAAAMDRVPS